MELNSGITIVGSGNVAWHLAHIFKKNNFWINYIVGRNRTTASELANSIQTKYSTKLDDIPDNTNLVLLCISDGVIEEIAHSLKNRNFVVAHTAGSVPLSAISSHVSNAGVFYPFQTFSKQIAETDIEFPICIESSNKTTQSLLTELATTISKIVVQLDSKKRKELHLAGVIANNFTNYLFAEAFNYLNKKEIDSNLLLPIIKQTVKKLEYDEPKNLQTGPARRGNREIINNHLEILGENKDLQDLYKLMSEKILQYYKNNNE